MFKKKEFLIYTGIWVVAVLILCLLLWQNIGDARVINYSGIVRGATQKLVKEELEGFPDDELIARIDGIIYDLQTGEGDYGLAKNSDDAYQELLAELKVVWEQMKEEIPRVRSKGREVDRLYELSQRHFDIADRMVLRAEKSSNEKLVFFIVVYFSVLLVSIAIFVFLNWRSRKALDKSVHYDRLTGIMNRAGFEAAAGALLRRNPSEEFVIAEFDVNNFKSVNNAFGYPAGDELLKNIAAALSMWEKSDKLCARIDADDFVLLIKNSEFVPGELERLLERVRVDQPFLQSFNDVAFTIGAYRIEHNEEVIKSAMDKANTAHKTAKSEINNEVVWYDKELLEKLETERAYKKRMRSALADQEFRLYLQPKINFEDMKIMGAEALVRWDIPDRGLVYPDSFIPLFEKNGLIADLDFYMLEKVCSYLRNLLDDGREIINVSVNFSRVTLCEKNFYKRFSAIVERYGIPHENIEIEVTESAFNELADSVIHILSMLHDDGFLVSMDDFGAGYSSLNMLIRLPIQIIKLDREFLKQIDHSGKVKGVIKSAVELAHSLGMKIICEGVERSGHVEYLREIGCDYGQGYYFSKPVPDEEFLKLERTE